MKEGGRMVIKILSSLNDLALVQGVPSSLSFSPSLLLLVQYCFVGR